MYYVGKFNSLIIKELLRISSTILSRFFFFLLALQPIVGLYFAAL